MAQVHATKAAEFDAAAHRQANTFWLWLIIAGILWWIGSLWWAAIPAALAVLSAIRSIRSSRTAFALRNGIRQSAVADCSPGPVNPPLDAESDVETWERAINDYGALLEDASTAIFPASYLPLPKDKMKQALKEAWRQVDDSYMREMIAVGYAQLSHFRDDVLFPLHDPLYEISRTTPAVSADAELMARKVVDNKAEIERYYKLFEKATAEYKDLLSEFRKFETSAAQPTRNLTSRS